MGSPVIPPLPAGFTLDSPSSGGGSFPPLPSGFTLDQPERDPNDVTMRPLLRGATSIGPTPWYRQGIFGGYGPSVQDAIDTLPAIGGAVGGVLGAGSGAFAGLGMGALPGAVGGAAVGGEAGEAWRQNARRALGAYAPLASGEAATEIGRQGGIQAASELGARALARGASVAFAPGAGMVDFPVAAAEARLATPLARESVEEAAVREGLDMPAAARSTARPVAVFESLAAKGLGGRQASERYVGAANSLTAMADHTVARASKLTDDSARGQAIASGLEAFRSNWIRTKAGLYKQAALPETGMKVQTQETVALLDDIIEGKGAAAEILKNGPAADAAFYRGLRDGLTKEVTKGEWVGEEYVRSTTRELRPVEASKLLQAHKELTQKIKASFSDPFSAANAGALKKVSATMQSEMDAAIRQADPALAARLDRANAAYAEGLTKINSTFGKNIHTLAKAGKYDKIAESVANSRVSVDDIPRIMEVAGAEGTEGMRAAVLADIVSKAKNPAGTLTPGGLQRAMKTFGEDRLSAILEPEQLARMKDIATLSASLQRGQKVMEGSQTAYLLGQQNILGLLNHIGGSPVRRFLASPVGQRWMTTGYRPFSRSAATTTATRAAHAGTVPFTAEDPE